MNMVYFSMTVLLFLFWSIYLEGWEESSTSCLSWNTKTLLLIKEKHDIITFLCRRRCKSQGFLRSILGLQLSSLGPVSCAFSPEGPPSPARCRYSLFPPRVPSRLTAWAAVMWWLDGCLSLMNSRRHS